MRGDIWYPSLWNVMFPGNGSHHNERRTDSESDERGSESRGPEDRVPVRVTGIEIEGLGGY